MIETVIPHDQAWSVNTAVIIGSGFGLESGYQGFLKKPGLAYLQAVEHRRHITPLTDAKIKAHKKIDRQYASQS